MNIYTYVRLIGCVFLLSGCGAKSGSINIENTVNTPIKTIIVSEKLTIADNRNVDSFRLLFIGNSHVSSNDLSGITAKLVELGTHKSVFVKVSSRQRYLDERISDGETKEEIISGKWTHVILQAQKYSQSGARLYSTRGAEQLANLSKKNAATPIFFPEHPQKGNREEGQYVHDIYKSITDNESACLAPIGLSWDAALALDASLPLHNADGNHAGLTGTFLSALVFYQVITGLSAEELPYIESIDVPESTQRLLRETATATITRFGDCDF